MLSKLASQELSQKILTQARALGASAAEVTVSSHEGFTVEVRHGAVETVEQNCGHGLTLGVYFGQCFGVASTSDFRLDALNLVVEKAGYIARHTEADACFGLAEAQLMAHSYSDLDLDHPWDLTTEAAIELGKLCEARGLACDQRIINSDGASVSTTRNLVVYGNTHGFIGLVPSTVHSLACSLIAEQNQKMQRDYDFTVARDVKMLVEAPRVGENAAQRTLARLGARTLTARKTPVIFTALLARELIGEFIDAISGRNLYNRTSFLVDSLGKPVFPEHLTITELPHLMQALGSSPFDAEGVATRDRDLVQRGVLMGYVLSSYSARKLKMTTTANAGGIHNVVVHSPHRYSMAELLKLMGTGLVITELLGHGVNLTTGDYSRGAFGFLVENGIIQYPVEGLTIAGNLRDMFLGIRAIADDLDTRGVIRTGALLVEQMTVAG